MTTRVTERMVTFARPFTFANADGTCPPGEYLVQTDEEAIRDISFVAWRRIATRIHVGRDGVTQVRIIDPAELELILSRDGGPASPG